MAGKEYRLVSVNTAPQRAARLIGSVTAALSDRYSIVHVANCERIEDVAPTVKELKPDLLFCASMWTSDEAATIQTIAQAIQPEIKTYALPHGLQVTEGPDAVVRHLIDAVPALLNSPEL